MNNDNTFSAQKQNNDESHKPDIKKILDIIKEQGLVPIGRTFGTDVHVMLAPKQLVDSGANRQTLIANALHLKISIDMLDYFKIYNPNDEKSSNIDSSNNNEIIDERKPKLNGSINRLILYEQLRCMICDKFSPDPITVFLECHAGWISCINCCEKGWLREEICIALNKNLVLPIKFLFEENFRGKWLFKINNIDYVILKFWRKSQQAVYVAMLSRNATLHSRTLSNGDNVINIQFIDHRLSDNPTESRTTVLSQELIQNIRSIKIEDQFLTRDVSLRNLLYYNPGLLEDILNTQNLFEHDFPVSISLDDLPDLKKNLENHTIDSNQFDGKFDQ